MNKVLLVGLIGLILALSGFIAIDQYFSTEKKVVPIRSLGAIDLPDKSRQLIFEIKGDGVTCIQTFHIELSVAGYFERIFPQLQCH